MPENGLIFRPGPLRGSIGVPGDKSISHRALIAGARCEAPLHIANLNPGRDVRATREALNALGASVRTENGRVVVRGGALVAPSAALDCMNSGSTVRMLLGLCAGANLPVGFDGDASLRRRPMEPVAAQLRAFGARIETTDGRLPVRLRGTPEVQTRHFILLTPSAQVKTALLFAGLFGGVGLRVDGDRGSRDHTERLLRYLGADIEWNEHSVTLVSAAPLRGGVVNVAGDFSAAAFFITGAAITPGSAILVRDVGVNATRTGLLEALGAMGAGIELRNQRTISGEPVADIAVEHRPLGPTNINRDLALRAIDEIPLLALAAAFAPGTTSIAGVSELRSKESDRIAGIERLLGAVSVGVAYDAGTLRIAGGSANPRSTIVQTDDDHRIAMAAAILACASGPLRIDSAKSLDVSFPSFVSALDELQKG
ncbi:MAG: 3-phosphoshikimate 1-carboxyvinyltransferase [Candidatus Eremiobacteraeota bacterium]|nr:3-phosphoshikimate 1-carboxyvinyltransferase [Candidatus Eremiobacteraeota bacterium]